MSKEEEGDDHDCLYQDLDLATETIQQQQLEAKLAERDKRIATLEHKAQLLGKELHQLRQENANLKRNIGSLYNTAKAEVTRRDNEITQLRRKVNTLTGPSSGGRGGGPAR